MDEADGCQGKSEEDIRRRQKDERMGKWPKSDAGGHGTALDELAIAPGTWSATVLKREDPSRDSSRRDRQLFDLDVSWPRQVAVKTGVFLVCRSVTFVACAIVFDQSPPGLSIISVVIATVFGVVFACPNATRTSWKGNCRRIVVRRELERTGFTILQTAISRQDVRRQ